MSLTNINRGSFLTSLTTNPDVMLAKATSVQRRIREMQTAFRELESTVNKTRQYWIGEAGDAHRDYYDEHKKDVEEVFMRLSEDVTDLREMARVYATTESEVTDLAEDLPSDVIV